MEMEALMPHVLNSETGMPVDRIVQLVCSKDVIMVQVPWKGLEISEDTLEPIKIVHEDVPHILL